jgi:class 3 adenylate cyclase
MEPARIDRKLTTILSADVKGYSRLMREDEAVSEIERLLVKPGKNLRGLGKAGAT